MNIQCPGNGRDKARRTATRPVRRPPLCFPRSQARPGMSHLTPLVCGPALLVGDQNPAVGWSPVPTQVLRARPRPAYSVRVIVPVEVGGKGIGSHETSCL